MQMQSESFQSPNDIPLAVAPASQPASEAVVCRSRRRVPLQGITDAPDETVVTIAEVSALSGFATVTLRLWARSEQPRGPRQFKVEGRPRYRLGEVRAWLSGAGSGR
ncbi:helix-turn-helix transcriptional regulator [Bosea sp. PAMC 26642]|uniref:helix-turn-helix transcriptional regulator n=1 Tax=Bosea sp. (strain PAMC 26642) TaxID=1792307 RepID=UPI000AE7482E|nr:hypothetical protein [Bosea sp. PAMC 26642]